MKKSQLKSLIKEEQPKLSRILVKIGYNLKVVSINEVSCFFSENKIVYLQTKERTYPTDFTLDELENVLENTQFFRVNRQFIISSDYIKNIHTSPYYKVELQFQPAEEITVSSDRVKDFKDWVRLDLEYIDNWSFWLDLKILWRTVPVVLTGAGAK